MGWSGSLIRSWHTFFRSFGNLSLLSSFPFPSLPLLGPAEPLCRERKIANMMKERQREGEGNGEREREGKGRKGEGPLVVCPPQVVDLLARLSYVPFDFRPWGRYVTAWRTQDSFGERERIREAE